MQVFSNTSSLQIHVHVCCFCFFLNGSGTYICMKFVITYTYVVRRGSFYLWTFLGRFLKSQHGMSERVLRLCKSNESTKSEVSVTSVTSRKSTRSRRSSSSLRSRSSFQSGRSSVASSSTSPKPLKQATLFGFGHKLVTVSFQGKDRVMEEKMPEASLFIGETFPVKCWLCNKGFKTAQGLSGHMRNVKHRGPFCNCMCVYVRMSFV